MRGHALKRSPWPVVLSLVLSPILLAQSEKWHDLAGRQVTGVPVRNYGPLVVFSEQDHTRMLRVGDLDDASLDRIADEIANLPAPAKWKESTASVAALHPRLQILQGDQLVEFDVGDRPVPEVFLVYFSAQWCGPCREFTPDLIAAYQELKQNPRLAGKFELIFVSNDRDVRGQLKYMRESGMPWPALRFRHLGRTREIERWSGRGIPCLVALTPDGQVLFHSYRGRDYLGPRQPLNLTQQLLRLIDDHNLGARREAHPLTARLHVRQAGTGDAAAQPYVIGTGLDPSLFQRLKIDQLLAILEVGPDGRVTDVATEPALSSFAADLFRRQVQEWLFLPEVQNGAPMPTRVAIPLSF